MYIQSAFVASVQFYVAFLAIGAVGELGPSLAIVVQAVKSSMAEDQADLTPWVEGEKTKFLFCFAFPT